jgi:copper chaperone
MTLTLTIPSMACSACADTITKAVQNLDSDAQVKADLTTKIVDIETKVPETQVKAAIAQAGYPVS